MWFNQQISVPSVPKYTTTRFCMNKQLFVFCFTLIIFLETFMILITFLVESKVSAGASVKLEHLLVVGEESVALALLTVIPSVELTDMFVVGKVGVAFA